SVMSAVMHPPCPLAGSCVSYRAAFLSCASCHARDQSLRRGRRANLGAGNEIDESLPASGPGAGALRPAIEVAWGVAGLDIFLRAHQPRISEIRRRLVDGGNILAIGEDDCRVVAARQIVKPFIPEAVVPHLQRMAQGKPVDFARQQLQKTFEIFGIEFLGGHELPVDRAQAVAQLAEALADKTRDRLPGAGQFPAVGAVARRLDREDETIRRLIAPFGPACRFEGRIIRPVDLDRSEMAAGKFQLALLRQPLGIENPATGLVNPASNADMDIGFHRDFFALFWRSMRGRIRNVTPSGYEPEPVPAGRSIRRAIPCMKVSAF